MAEWSGRGAHVDAVEQHRGGCEVAQADEDLRLPTRRSHHMNDRTFDRVSIEFHNIVKDDQTTVRHGQTLRQGP